MARLSEEADMHGELIPAFVPDETPFDLEQWAAEFVWKGAFFDEPKYLPRAEAGWSERVEEQLKFVERLAEIPPELQASAWPVPVMTETSRLFWLSVLAHTVDPRFEVEIEKIRDGWPVEYHILRAEYLAAGGAAMAAFEEYFVAVNKAKTHPLIREGYHRVLWQGIEALIGRVEFTSVEQMARYFEATNAPLSFAALTDGQRRVLVSLSMPMPQSYKVRAAEAWGDHPEWDEQVLRFRRDIFKQTAHRGYAQAERDYARWSRSVRRKALDRRNEDDGG